MISREMFIKTLELLDAQMQKDIAFSEGLNKLFPNAHAANLLPDNELLIDATIQLLETSMEDAPTDVWQNSMDSWITYFCWELDFGRENYRLPVFDNQQVVPMSNAGELYDFLIQKP